jgi:hypothetical protein
MAFRENYLEKAAQRTASFLGVCQNRQGVSRSGFEQVVTTLVRMNGPFRYHYFLASA